MQAIIEEFTEKLDKNNKIGDDKDLEISRLRRENEDLLKSKKNQSEKILEYQSTNERLRKDKQQMEDSITELNKKIETMEQLAKSAALMMGKGEFDEVDNNIGSSGGLGGELRELEEMDGSFAADVNNQSMNRSSSIKDRRATFCVDLNQSMNSDN